MRLGGLGREESPAGSQFYRSSHQCELFSCDFLRVAAILCMCYLSRLSIDRFPQRQNFASTPRVQHWGLLLAAGTWLLLRDAGLRAARNARLRILSLDEGTKMKFES